MLRPLTMRVGPELALFLGCLAGRIGPGLAVLGAFGGPAGSIGKPMTLLTKLYERRAKDCIRAAALANDEKERELLLKWAREWMIAAFEEATDQSKPLRRRVRAH
jgi:hypothetical protein